MSEEALKALEERDHLMTLVKTAKEVNLHEWMCGAPEASCNCDVAQAIRWAEKKLGMR